MTVLPPPAPGCESCAARDVVIAEQGAAIAELRSDLVALASEVRDLRRRLGRNSGNSSMPPSADDLPGRVPPERQRRGKGSGRSRGKQPGAPGTSMTWAEPDEVIDHRPAGACGCGADLALAEDLGVARSHQQLEVPLVTARRIQHDLHEFRCGCGAVHVAGRPAGVPESAVSIGPDLRALAVYLVIYQHVPVARCAELIADLTGARVSAGFIHSCLAKAADVIADVVKLIKTLITAAHVAGFDETTLRCGPAGTKKYVQAAVTELYSLFFLGRRTLESFRDFGILPAFAGVVVSDRYVNYFHDDWEHITGNQVCCSLEDLGRVLAQHGDNASAIAALDEALTISSRVGASWDAARVRGRLRRLGVRRRTVKVDRPRTGWEALTEAEAVVANLAAHGCTNREIADKLFISQHTVHSHVRHVFEKLGINSRVHLTMLAAGRSPESPSDPHADR